MLTTSEERLWGGGVSAGSGPSSGQRPPPLARRPLVNCAAQRPPASVRLPLHLRRIRPADGARAVRLRAERQGQVSGCSVAPATPRSTPCPTAKGRKHLRVCLLQPGTALSPRSQHIRGCMVPRLPKRQHPVPTAPQNATMLPPGTGMGSTFNHLSTHLAWNSWLQGRTRRSCRASKSLKHTTHLGEAAIHPSVRPLLHGHSLQPSARHARAPPLPPQAHSQGLLRLVALRVEAVGREVLDVCFGESPRLGLPETLSQV